jgi:small subunit ribosomal protein S17
MSDDEQKKDETPEQEPQDESPQDAGPVSDTSSSPTGEDPASSPPASDASEEEAPATEAPEEDAADTPAPAAEAEPNPEDDLPWKERRRLARSRRPHKAGPALDEEGRKAERAKARERKAALRRKQRAATKAAHAAGTGTPPAERDSNAAKVRQGIVVSSKGDKSITVRIDTARRHRTYEKIVRSSTKLHAHDERNEAGEGDVVRVIETRPLSKTKRWRLVDVVEKAR